jgi:RNA polymerase sigma factor (sigma-70 family)
MATAVHLRIVPHGDLDAPEREDRAHGLVVDDAFVQAHAGYVRRLVCRMGVPVSDVDDAVQEVFLAALRRAATFEVGRSPRAWLFGIARHCARKIYRGAREVSAGEPPEPSVGPEQETALERKRARSMVHQALDALPEAQRDVVILHKLEGWSMPSVADAVGCTVATAHSRYRLGRIHIERIIRGRVVRARMAAAVAMVMAFLGWNAPTAAAAAVTACLVGGGFLLSQSPAPLPWSPGPPMESGAAPSTRASGMRAPARPSEGRRDHGVAAARASSLASDRSERGRPRWVR